MSKTIFVLYIIQKAIVRTIIHEEFFKNISRKYHNVSFALDVFQKSKIESIISRNLRLFIH